MGAPSHPAALSAPKPSHSSLQLAAGSFRPGPLAAGSASVGDPRTAPRRPPATYRSAARLMVLCGRARDRRPGPREPVGWGKLREWRARARYQTSLPTTAPSRSSRPGRSLAARGWEFAAEPGVVRDACSLCHWREAGVGLRGASHSIGSAGRVAPRRTGQSPPLSIKGTTRHGQSVT